METQGTRPAYMQQAEPPKPFEGSAPLRSFTLTATPTGFVGRAVLREGTAGRSFDFSYDGKQLTFDGAPASSVTLSHDDITGQISVERVIR